MRKLRKNDQVIVRIGKDKGKQGVIDRVLPDKNKVIVRGVNLVKKHQKPNPNKNQPGGIINKEMPIDISNVAIFNSETNKADRVVFKIEDDKKIRVYKSTQKPLN